MNITSRWVVSNDETFLLTSRVANQLSLAIVSTLHRSEPLTFRELAFKVYLSYHIYFMNKDIKEVNDATVSEMLYELIKSDCIKIHTSDDGDHKYELIVDSSLDTPLDTTSNEELVQSYGENLDFSNHLNNLYA